MQKTDNLPPRLLDELHQAGVEFTIIKGALYYNDVKDYKAGQKIIRRLEKELPRQGYKKYGNRKVKLILTIPYGAMQIPAPTPITFDSEDEADYYFHLKDLETAGQVKNILIHPELELFCSFNDLDGKHQNHIILTPDFYVEYTDGRREYIDIKGFAEEAACLRRKLYDLLAAKAKDRPFYQVPLRWIASNFKHAAPGSDGWIEYDELQQKLAAQRKAKKANEKAKGAAA